VRVAPEEAEGIALPNKAWQAEMLFLKSKLGASYSTRRDATSDLLFSFGV